jgi:hypothetical protein
MASELEKLLSMGSMAAGGGQAQAALGAAQTLYGLSQMPKARAEMERARASAPSLETPSQFYENYKNAYDSELARMQSDAIQQNLATSVQALQGAGGRALVGGLGAATMGAQRGQQQMLAGERAARLQAGQQLATAQERAIGRQEARSQRDMAYANQAYQAALGNVGGGIGAIGKGLMFAGQGTQGVGGTEETIDTGGTGEIETTTPRQNFVNELTEEEKQDAIRQSSSPMYGYGGKTTKGMMTKGAFNHNTNPIDLVQNGEKVGEATGGEYIINPTQAKKISKESSFARKLFKRFERNARKNK